METSSRERETPVILLIKYNCDECHHSPVQMRAPLINCILREKVGMIKLAASGTHGKWLCMYPLPQYQ